MSDEMFFFFFQAEDGIRDGTVTGVQTCALPISTVLAVDVLRGLALLVSQKQSSAPGYDFVFLDPPYAAAEDYSRVLEFLGSTELLAPGGIVIAEHRRNFDLPEEAGALRRFRVLKQGDAALSFYRRHG